eukprot:CAMPEP_0198736640 /NCGR_PEP_ID=MMETSP1475-20131203/67227_1 /TAXON_ID= ORGANISM="Unidentified sp., Strain CCMP1999" /NCGR_SAMPLE_ID=MMETSP1475 /ASSEMBLY_ACC=CAM_ASM_001111 /LENGTH=187 /DNA_ID=CAMNT_0044500485 /DNA_START=605 /DNA_END=1169 /DNA_ORIENTATION=-
MPAAAAQTRRHEQQDRQYCPTGAHSSHLHTTVEVDHFFAGHSLQVETEPVCLVLIVPIPAWFRSCSPVLSVLKFRARGELWTAAPMAGAPSGISDRIPPDSGPLSRVNPDINHRFCAAGCVAGSLSSTGTLRSTNGPGTGAVDDVQSESGRPPASSAAAEASAAATAPGGTVGVVPEEVASLLNVPK